MELLWKLINPNSNAPITGGAAGTAYKIRRGADGNLFDFDDMTFKASGWTTLSAALSEVDAAHLPGVYRGSIDTTLWQNGEYQFDATYSAGNVLLYATDRVALQDGVEAVTVGAVNERRAMCWIPRMTPLKPPQRRRAWMSLMASWTPFMPTLRC